MKLFLIALVLIFSLASCTISEVKSKRGVDDEEMALELQYYGSCREWKQEVLRSVWVNKFSNCLPIRVGVAQNPDNDDLHSHYYCTNYDQRRSIIHFPEIYETHENVPYRNFVLSLVPTAPFRVLTRGVSVSRRPNCFTTQDYCNGTNYIVNGCSSNDVEYRLDEHEDRHDDYNDHHDKDWDRHDDHRDGYDRHGKRNTIELKNNRPQHDRRRRRFIVNKDRVYITANQQRSDVCKTSASECCPYVSHESFGGICPRTASQQLNDFPKRRPYHNHHDDHHDNHYDDDHRDGRPGFRPGNNRPGYDNDDRDGRPDGRPGRPGFNGRPGDRDGKPDFDRRPDFNGHHDDEDNDYDKKRTEETK